LVIFPLLPLFFFTIVIVAFAIIVSRLLYGVICCRARLASLGCLCRGRRRRNI
jgi:hypothetical protein